MSNIYCHEDVIDFTDPFQQFDEGHRVPLAVVEPVRKVAVVPVSPLTILAEAFVMHLAFFALFLLLYPLSSRHQDTFQDQADKKQDEHLCIVVVL